MVLLGIALFIVGMNYLKGTKMFGDEMYLYAEYKDVQGLIPSNPVTMNGMRVGKVRNMQLDMKRRVVVTELEFDNPLQIPLHAEAMISNSNLLGSKAIQIVISDTITSLSYYQSGDTIRGTLETGFFDVAQNFVAESGEEISLKISLLASELINTIGQFNKLLRDPQGRRLILEILQDIRTSTENVKTISYHIDSLSQKFLLMADDAGSIVHTVASHTGEIDTIIYNSRVSSDSLVAVMTNLRALSDDAKKAAAGVERIMSRIDTSNGSISMLLKDKEIYESLKAATENANKLIEDVRKQPTRYVDDVKIYLIERKPLKEKKAKRQVPADQ